MAKQIKQNRQLHKTAPLPFIGQKRNFINHFIKVINDNIEDDGQGWTIVDAFGGSGLLSHVSKAIKPKATVIYNDFDDYHRRLQHISDTNRLRQALFDILKALPRGKKLEKPAKQTVINCIANFDGFVDWKTVGTWILFSGKFVNNIDELRKQTLYNRIRLSDFASADDYLQGLIVVKTDFEELLKQHQNNPKCLFILDPPYICTEQGMYANKSYFGMVEFLRLMRLVRPPFIFFSSTRSELVEYLDFVIHYKAENYEPLQGYQRIAINTIVNSSAKYEDNLIYQFKGVAK